MLVHNLGTQLRIFLATGRCCCHTNLSCISIGDLLSKQQARFTHGFIIQSVSHVCLLLNQVMCPPVFLSSLDSRMQRIATPGSKTLVCKSIFAIFKSPLQASNKDFNTAQWCNPLHRCCVYNPVICSLQCVILLPLLLGPEEKLLPKFSPSEIVQKLQKLFQNGQISDFFSMHRDFQKAPANCSNDSFGFCLFLDFSLLHATAC